MLSEQIFPFTGIVGQDDFKLCLILNLIDPSIGGVLAAGDQGTGKTTTARALTKLIPSATFVNLPIGSTIDRVLGSIALEPLLKEQKTVIDQGLLAKANKGILYIDEVNLLCDELVDTLLDAAAFKGYALEREGISIWQESAFCLIGTMNPEEGDLRTQLKDRFGLSTTIETPQDIKTRTQITTNRLHFEVQNPDFISLHQQKSLALTKQIQRAKKNLKNITIPKRTLEEISKICVAANVTGLRADLTLLKALKSYASFLETTIITKEMIEKIAPFVLNHRKKPPSNNAHNNQDKKNNSTQPPPTETPKIDQKIQQDELPNTIKNRLRFEVKKKS